MLSAANIWLLNRAARTQAFSSYLSPSIYCSHTSSPLLLSFTSLPLFYPDLLMGHLNTTSRHFLSVCMKILDCRNLDWVGTLVVRFWVWGQWGGGVPRCGSIKNYRQVPHNSTELPPATLLFGRTVKGHWEAFLHTWAYDSANEIVITSSVHVAELKTKMEHGWKLAATNLRQACKKSYLEFQQNSKARRTGIWEENTFIVTQQ